MKIFTLAFEQAYLPGKPVLPLTVVAEYSDDDRFLRACISDQVDTLHSLFSQNKSLEEISSTLAVALLDFSQVLRLQPVHIPKPWGQEIWFTGMEARGVSQVISASGATPLSWVLALAQQQILGKQSTLNLLKILDPLPDEVFGDLYFELHEQKREVYIVTHIDCTAWPDGVGAIRYGFSTEKRQQYDNDQDFLSAYKQAVQEYSLVRRDIDRQLDICRQHAGIAASEPVSAAQTQVWLASVLQEQQALEQTLRQSMESFTALRPLHKGDVLAVPLRTPHALQHGVRTIEFQTPVYERKILSFAQKVLTQEHWDTEEALQLAELETPKDQVFPVLSRGAGVLLEQIVEFDDFVVQRLHLSAGSTFSCSTNENYCLLMTVTGKVSCGNEILQAEQACLIPASVDQVELDNTSSEAATILLARPV